MGLDTGLKGCVNRLMGGLLRAADLGLQGCGIGEEV